MNFVYIFNRFWNKSNIYHIKEELKIISMTIFIFISFITMTSNYNTSFSTSLKDSSDIGNNISKTPIKHIIVIVQGGRSFDHYFGTYPHANGPSNDTNIPLNPFDKENKEYFKPFHLETTRTLSPLYGSQYNKISYNNGSMNGFVYLQDLYGFNKELVMGYYDYRDIPYYWNFASRYVLADNFFSPTMGTGLINYLYLYAGDSYDYGTTIIPKQGFNIDKTIFDNLETKKLDWKTYMRNYDHSINYTNDMVRTKNVSDTQIIRNPLLGIPRFIDNQTLNSHIVDLTEYFNDLKNNTTFPNLSYIILKGLNEQASSNVAEGQQLVASLVFSLMQSQYWKDSVIILTYDQSGGWYDHVAPPSPSKDNNYREYGFRVPTLVISPYAKQGYIDNTFYDSTSILKFIESVFELPSLTKNDAIANNMSNAFDFNSPHKDPFIPPMVYTQNINESDADVTLSQYKSNNNTIQLIYAILLALLVLLGIVLFWYGKRLKKGQRLSQ